VEEEEEEEAVAVVVFVSWRINIEYQRPLPS
jgi:hypothetical protein